MSATLGLLKLLTESRDTYNKFATSFKSLPGLDREVKLIFNLIQRYYDQYPEHNYVGQQELMAFYDYCYPSNHESGMHKEQIKIVFEAEVSTSILTDLWEQVAERHYANEILNYLVPVIDGNKYGVLPNIRSHLDTFISLMKNPPQETKGLIPCDLTVSELVNREIADPGIPWHLGSLNAVIGGIRRQTLGCIFAFVDSGKTSFGLAACASFARHLKDTSETIVYAGNEESASRLSLRMTQAMLNVTRRQIAENHEEYNQQRREVGYSRVKILDSISDSSQILRILDEWRPAILFIDQGSKVNMDGRSQAKEVEYIRNLYNFYREKAKEYDTAIVCLEQGVGEAENRKWLRLSDIYGSRVAIQGELDYGIGIGRLLDDAYAENFRYINVPKNKLLEGETTRFETLFTKELCHWKAT